MSYRLHVHGHLREIKLCQKEIMQISVQRNSALSEANEGTVSGFSAEEALTISVFGVLCHKLANKETCFFFFFSFFFFLV